MTINKINARDNRPLCADMLRAVAALTTEHASAVKDGWRAIIEAQTVGDSEPFFLLDVQDNQGGGNYAEAKMNTLRRFPDMVATGLETPRDFAKRLEAAVYQLDIQDRDRFKCLVDQIAAASYTEHLCGTVNETLRDYLGVTTYKGAFRVRFQVLTVVEDTQTSTHSVELRIAFSGAEEWQDMLFGMWLLTDFQKALYSRWEHDQITFELKALEAEPQYEMWIDLLRVRSV